MTLVYPAVVFPFCGDRLFMEGAAFLAVAGLSLMIYALRRDIVIPPRAAA